ncbi:hypothetical protein PsYK624_102680 [Phanerochaete sordida]|uniref:Uncharacterized protein n=1 Tax=Phanerochaete sordida TaxID=48140 RepID=A0A9P3GFT1_9APHY|nr:hypothetical protein PsYK624_102680 [Phanerochaete sordida]
MARTYFPTLRRCPSGIPEPRDLQGACDPCRGALDIPVEEHTHLLEFALQVVAFLKVCCFSDRWRRLKPRLRAATRGMALAFIGSRSSSASRRLSGASGASVLRRTHPCGIFCRTGSFCRARAACASSSGSSSTVTKRRNRVVRRIPLGLRNGRQDDLRLDRPWVSERCFMTCSTVIGTMSCSHHTHGSSTFFRFDQAFCRFSNAA